MRRVLDRRIASWFAFATTITIIVAMSLFMTLLRTAEDWRKIEVTHEMDGVLENLGIQINAAMSSGRFYTFRGDAGQLSRYRAALALVNTHRRVAARLVIDDPVRQIKIRQLDSLIGARLAILKPLVEQRLESGRPLTGPMPPRVYEASDSLSRKIREQIPKIREEETALGKRLTLSATSTAQRTIVLVFLGTIANLMICGIFLSLVMRESAMRRRADETLRQSEERFRGAFEAAGVGMALASPDGRLLRVNRSLCEILGYSEEEMLSKTLVSLSDPDGLEDEERQLRRILDGDIGTYQLEKRYLHKSGSMIWGNLSVSLVRNAEGAPVQLAMVLEDVTKRKQSEEAVRESDRRFRAIFEQTFQFTGLLAPDGTTLESNQTSLDFFGIERDDVIGKPFWETGWWQHSPESRGRLRSAFEQAVDGRFVREELDVWDARGRLRTIDFSLKPVFDDAGRVVLLIPEGRDITARKVAEESIRESEERFRLVADQAPVIIWMKDATQGDWNFLNRTGVEFFGKPLEDLLGPGLVELVYPDDRARRDEAYHEGFSSLGPFEVEYRMKRADGAYRWVADHAVPRLFPDGSFAGYIGSMTDVTERKQASEALARAKEAAESTTRAKTAILANISHEIRTPMNGVLGMAELLLDTTLGGVQRDYAVTIRNSAEALLTIINDILDLSKIEAGKVTIEEVEFNLRTLMEEIADLLSPRAHQKGLQISCHVPPDFPEQLLGDPVHLRQILTNLMGNAVKFTESGEVAIEATTHGEVDGKVALRISIRDTGIGIPEEQHAAVFESFTQADPGTGRRFGGTGLGLAISRQLARRMGGEIGLESEPGVGSTFWLEVALARKQAEAAPSDRRRGGLGGFRVLIIDENATNRRILREHFLSWGCRVEDASSSTEALKQLGAAPRDQLPGVILVDERLARIDGESLAEVIRNTPALGAIPRILIRSLGRKEAEDDPATSSLFQATLTKPVRRSQLLNTVIDLVDQDSGASTSRRPSSTNAGRSTRIGLRVLVADDHEVNRKVALWMLGQLGCQAKAVANGREAIDTLESQHFDVVLMDVQMPLMDGLEATLEIRQREASLDRPRIPILALTAHAMEGDRQRCLAAGMDGYVSKPVTQRELYDTLMVWSSRIRDEAARGEAPVRTEAGSPWRHEDLLQNCGDNEEIVRDVVETFLETTPGFLDRMHRAFRDRDLRAVAREAHGLRGNSLCIGASTLAATSVEIEERCRRVDGAGVEESIAVAQSAWEELREVLARLSRPKVP